MEKSLIHSNELHFISKKRIHQAVEKMVESLDLAAGSTTGFNIYAVVESYFTDLEKRKEINQLLNLEQDVCEEVEAELGVIRRINNWTVASSQRLLPHSMNLINNI